MPSCFEYLVPASRKLWNESKQWGELGLLSTFVRIPSLPTNPYKKPTKFDFSFPCQFVVYRHQDPLPVRPSMIILGIFVQNIRNILQFLFQEGTSPVGFQQSSTMVPDLNANQNEKEVEYGLNTMNAWKCASMIAVLRTCYAPDNFWDWSRPKTPPGPNLAAPLPCLRSVLDFADIVVDNSKRYSLLD